MRNDPNRASDGSSAPASHASSQVNSQIRYAPPGPSQPSAPTSSDPSGAAGRHQAYHSMPASLPVAAVHRSGTLHSTQSIAAASPVGVPFAAPHGAYPHGDPAAPAQGRPSLSRLRQSPYTAAGIPAGPSYHATGPVAATTAIAVAGVGGGAGTFSAGDAAYLAAHSGAAGLSGSPSLGLHGFPASQSASAVILPCSYSSPSSTSSSLFPLANATYALGGVAAPLNAGIDSLPGSSSASLSFASASGSFTRSPSASAYAGSASASADAAPALVHAGHGGGPGPAYVAVRNVSHSPALVAPSAVPLPWPPASGSASLAPSTSPSVPSLAPSPPAAYVSPRPQHQAKSPPALQQPAATAIAASAPGLAAAAPGLAAAAPGLAVADPRLRFFPPHAVRRAREGPAVVFLRLPFVPLHHRIPQASAACLETVAAAHAHAAVGCAPPVSATSTSTSTMATAALGMSGSAPNGSISLPVGSLSTSTGFSPRPPSTVKHAVGGSPPRFNRQASAEGSVCSTGSVASAVGKGQQHQQQRQPFLLPLQLPGGPNGITLASVAAVAALLGLDTATPEGLTLAAAAAENECLSHRYVRSMTIAVDTTDTEVARLIRLPAALHGVVEITGLKPVVPGEAAAMRMQLQQRMLHVQKQIAGQTATAMAAASVATTLPPELGSSNDPNRISNSPYPPLSPLPHPDIALGGSAGSASLASSVGVHGTGPEEARYFSVIDDALPRARFAEDPYGSSFSSPSLAVSHGYAHIPAPGSGSGSAEGELSSGRAEAAAGVGGVAGAAGRSRVSHFASRLSPRKPSGAGACAETAAGLSSSLASAGSGPLQQTQQQQQQAQGPPGQRLDGPGRAGSCSSQQVLHEELQQCVDPPISGWAAPPMVCRRWSETLKAFIFPAGQFVHGATYELVLEGADACPASFPLRIPFSFVCLHSL